MEAEPHRFTTVTKAFLLKWKWYLQEEVSGISYLQKEVASFVLSLLLDAMVLEELEEVTSLLD